MPIEYHTPGIWYEVHAHSRSHSLTHARYGAALCDTIAIAYPIFGRIRPAVTARSSLAVDPRRFPQGKRGFVLRASDAKALRAERKRVLRT